MCVSSSQLTSTWGAALLSIVMKEPGRAQNLRLTPLSAIGLGLVVIGSWIRQKAYKAMGPQFTGQLSIHKNHKLITTGPYRYVRHPSYTGLLAVYPGMLVWFCSHGSWLRESGVMETLVGSVFFYSVGLCVGGFVVLGVSRMGREDKELKRVFGEEWEAWARRVPYRLVPGL